jgi:hypothetical protein
MTQFFNQSFCVELEKAGIKEESGKGWAELCPGHISGETHTLIDLTAVEEGNIITPAFTKYSILEHENAKKWWGEKEICICCGVLSDKVPQGHVIAPDWSWKHYSFNYLDLIQEGKTIEELQNYLEGTRG